MFVSYFLLHISIFFVCKTESETVILKIIRYSHLFVHGLDRGLGFSNVQVRVPVQVPDMEVRVHRNWTRLNMLSDI